MQRLRQIPCYEIWNINMYLKNQVLDSKLHETETLFPAKFGI